MAIAAATSVSPRWPTDDLIASATMPARALPALERVRGAKGQVLVAMCPDLSAAMALIRRPRDDAHHARLFRDEPSARQFAEALATGRATWADEEA